MRVLEGEDVVVVVEEEKKTTGTEEEADEDKLPDDLRTLTVYPEPLMTNEQVRQGGFFLYVFGKLQDL